MYRVEMKYTVNAHQRDLMANKLGNLCLRDPFSDEDGGYVVTSLYYDDYNQSALFDKLSGVRDRVKFRVRVYNRQSDVIKLERKIRRGYVTEKSHLRISREEYVELLSGDVGFLRHKEHVVAEEFYLRYRTLNLRPRVVVEYRREAYIFKYGDVRITFDDQLKAGVFRKDLFSNGYLISAIPQDQIILEVKYRGYFPDVVRRIVQIDNLQWQSSSKYVKCCVASM